MGSKKKKKPNGFVDFLRRLRLCSEQGCRTITVREKCAKHLTADVIRKAARPDKALS